MSLQAKLLRVIQEREVERIGGTRTLLLDFRVSPPQTATSRTCWPRRIQGRICTIVSEHILAEDSASAPVRSDIPGWCTIFFLSCGTRPVHPVA